MYIDETSLETSPNWELLFRKKHPRTSFMRNATNAFLEDHGIFPVQPFSRKLNKEYRVLEPQKVDDRWFEVLEII
tara:strand:- start:4312 stop:4536 length:225 start_codon:yes stop_codon:yes gene_type:complete